MIFAQGMANWIITPSPLAAPLEKVAPTLGHSNRSRMAKSDCHKTQFILVKTSREIMTAVERTKGFANLRAKMKDARKKSIIKSRKNYVFSFKAYISFWSLYLCHIRWHITLCASHLLGLPVSMCIYVHVHTNASIVECYVPRREK